ncbi:MAG: DUF402 domain-containing protein [Gemmatimonadetes bacterium]|uniref:DUF402 domain-containing protein n=1 Tax=Candidatus Kutchimonas denitrificans TaxID=3056748 RepID=A0AAE5CBZ2_9BACT|nr:DUF402 domain-containing protein [Gemmatimonadota bacterium]NIR76472.1 DUF402 domain-containing protein [Candidatus Kutchimonas denitrificans]NIS03290.1 DUF402 domain-containing protein [Gemmatimonadota bacterium]NIT69151.1 DUF402 domain-containing protein [Gemmatimonadota bacterium]NIU54543.1 DUF402 domain-containing protein [Gemmatimonadota bacterium]
MHRVEIRYHRPPDRLDVFHQQLVVDRPDCKVTLHEDTPLPEPLQVGATRIYEPGAPIVWFVFPDAWHDVGRFHLEDGTFTGYYVNLIIPVDIQEAVWTMYDLCLDLWVDPSGGYVVLDQDEFDEAVDRGWIDGKTARRARQELEALTAGIDDESWPPEIVHSHDLARVRRLAAG